MTSDYTSATGWGWETEEKTKLFAASTSIFVYLKSTYYFVIFFNRKMRSHGIYGSLQLSKFMRNRCSEASPCWFRLLIISYLVLSSEDSPCCAQTVRKKTAMASDNSKHSGKNLNTQSTWSFLFCVSTEVKHLNILTDFSVITNTRFYCILR